MSLLSIGELVLAFCIGAFVCRTLMHWQLGTTPQRLKKVLEGLARQDFVPEAEKKRKRRGVFSALMALHDEIQTIAARTQQTVNESILIHQALENTSTNIMIADKDATVHYMNKSMHGFLENAQDAIREHFGSFDPDKVLGTNMDDFHKNPAHQRGLISKLAKTYVSEIEVSGRTFRLIANPIVDTEGNRLGTVVEWADRSEEVKLTRDNYFIRQALEYTDTNLMMADADAKIGYMNKSMREFFVTVQNDLRDYFGRFNPEKLMGANIDDFHKNPAHQRGLISRLTSTYTTEIEVGRRTFKLIANPIIDEGGLRMGTVVEWADRTEEKSIEKEVQEVVNQARSGNLSLRIRPEGKTGFIASLSNEVNDLLNIAEHVTEDMARVLEALVDGKLTEKIDTVYEGEFDNLKQNANSTIDKLIDVVSDMQQTADKVRSGASELASGSLSLSRRTEEQATSLGTTASSMEEMTHTVKQVAHNATEVDTIARELQKQAEAGGAIVEEAVSAMKKIDTSSKSIGDILTVINEIAVQTNLLALNASVEAARAGESGRGFAVVATEVRNLALRSATAAQEIKELIEDSRNRVEEGSVLVNKSGKTLQEIVKYVKKVTALIGELASASHEQSIGLEHINVAIVEIDSLTKQNASLVEETALASKSLGELAKTLESRISFFDTGRAIERFDTKKLTEGPDSQPAQVETADPSEQDWNQF